MCSPGCPRIHDPSNSASFSKSYLHVLPQLVLRIFYQVFLGLIWKFQSYIGMPAELKVELVVTFLFSVVCKVLSRTMSTSH